MGSARKSTGPHMVKSEIEKIEYGAQQIARGGSTVEHHGMRS